MLTETDYTTQEYLERVRHIRDLFLSPADLAVTCLILLSFDKFDLLLQNPLLKYAAQGWGEHSRGLDDCPTVTKYAVELLRDIDKVKLVEHILWPPKLLRVRVRGTSALHLCSFFGLRGIAERLLQEGQKPDLLDSESDSPLHYASRDGHPQMVELLFRTGKVEINARDKCGHSPLFRAIKNGHEGVVKLLLDTGKVDVDPRDKEGYSSLFEAAWNGHEGIVKLLIETGKVDVDPRDKLLQARRRPRRNTKVTTKTWRNLTHEIDSWTLKETW